MKLGLLVKTAGKQEGKLLEIKLPQFLIGRDPQCQLRPASPLISKRHCAIIQRDGKAFIRDFDSTNGTFVNDKPVKGECELKHNDELKIGPIIFSIVLEEAAKAPASPTKPSSNTPIPPTKALPGKSPVASKPTTTPLPATAPAVTGGKPQGEDEDIAAMLLSLDDDDPSSGGSGEGVPEGSTVFDMQVPQNLVAGGAKEEKKDAPKPPALGDTRSAAARILEKMTRRPRS